jgi:hypothetical protein
MITPVCDKCDEELTEFGAIVYGPPDSEGKCYKWHVCVRCYETIIDWLKLKLVR